MRKQVSTTDNDPGGSSGNLTNDAPIYNSTTAVVDLLQPADNIEYVLHYICLPIVVAFGMFGIIMTVTVLTRKRTFTSTNCYLTALAVSDLIFLIFVSFTLLDNLIINNYGTLGINTFRVFIEKITPVMDAICMTSVWMTVTLTMERYIAVCHPMRALVSCGVTGSRIVIVTIIAVCVLLRAPIFFLSQITYYYDPSLNATTVYLEDTALTNSHTFILVYILLVDVLIMVAVPFFLLLIFNLLIVLEIRRSTRYLKRRLNIGSCIHRIISAEQLQLTLILGGIVVVFFICQVPYVIFVMLLQMTRIGVNIIDRAFYYTREITLLLMCVKSSLHYALYCWFSEKFRNTFKRLFCMVRCFPKSTTERRNSDHTAVINTTRETTF